MARLPTLAQARALDPDLVLQITAGELVEAYADELRRGGLSEGDRLLTSPEMARRAATSDSSMRAILRSGAVPGARKQGKRWVALESASRKWLTAGSDVKLGRPSLRRRRAEVPSA